MSDANRLLGLLSPHQRHRMGNALMAEQYNRPTPHDTLPAERATLLPLATYQNGMTGPALPGLLAQPVESFNNLLQYGYQPGTGDVAGVEDAFNVAGGAFTGGLLAPRPRNSLGMFGGRGAKTADTAALAKAEALEAAGTPREDIWRDTGWFKGVDGKWRFEIDDRAAIVFPEMYDVNRKTESSARFRDRMAHPDYLSAYPAAENLSVQRTSEGGKFREGIGIAFDASAPDRGRAIALHELQHDAQAREGFARGGNPVTAAYESSGFQAYEKKIAELKALIAKPNEPDWLTRDRMNYVRELEARRPLEIMIHGDDIYRRQAGEVEARAVEARRDMLPDQRRSRPPWLDYDIPEADQIIRFRP